MEVCQENWMRALFRPKHKAPNWTETKGTRWEYAWEWKDGARNSRGLTEHSKHGCRLRRGAGRSDIQSQPRGPCWGPCVWLSSTSPQGPGLQARARGHTGLRLPGPWCLKLQGRHTSVLHSLTSQVRNHQGTPGRYNHISSFKISGVCLFAYKFCIKNLRRAWKEMKEEGEVSV